MVKILLLISLTLLYSCAHIAINTEPSGAMVYVDGEYVGNSPVAIKPPMFSFTDQIRVRCEMDGYTPAEQIIVYEEETTTSYSYGQQYQYGQQPIQQYGSSTSTSGGWPQNVFIRLHKNKDKK